MESIDSIRIHFNPEQLGILNFCLAFIMFGVALDLKVDNFRELLKTPKAPLVGLSSQIILLPLLTLGLVYLIQPPMSIALGMLLVSACPGGNVSNFAVHLSKGNTALSVMLTSISTLAAIITTPLIFALLAPLAIGDEAMREDIYVNPFDMLWAIVQLTLLPLLLGMFMHYRLPRIAARIRRPIRILSMIIFLGFIVVAVYGNLENIRQYLHLVFFIVLIHNATGLLGGYSLAKTFGLSRADARAISLETGIQNSGLGLILIFNFFDGLGGMALIAVWWGIWHLISAFSLASWWGRKGGDV